MKPEQVINELQDHLYLNSDDPPSSSDPAVIAALAPLKQKLEAARSSSGPPDPVRIMAAAQSIYVRCIVGVLEEVEREDEWRMELAGMVYEMRSEALGALRGMGQSKKAQAFARSVAQGLLSEDSDNDG